MTGEPISEKKIFARETKLMFGQVREDAAVDLYLISQIPDLQRVLVIASGGCTAFSILGAHKCRVDALDINAGQIALVELKQSIFRKLGFAEGKKACVSDGREQFDQVKASLSADSQSILSPLREHFCDGLNLAGWVDRSMRQLSKLFFILFHSRKLTEEFLSMNDPAQETKFYNEKWNSLPWQLAMRIAFNKTFLQLRHGSAAAQLVPDDFSQFMEARLKRSLTQFPNRANPYIWQAFLGRYHGDDASLPPYLQEKSASHLTDNLANLHLNLGDMVSWFSKQESNSIDYFGLSNVLELLPSTYAESLLPELIRCARPGAIICVRAIFPKRGKRTFVDPTTQIVLDEPLTNSAQDRDRSLFCNFYEVYRSTKSGSNSL